MAVFRTIARRLARATGLATVDQFQLLQRRIDQVQDQNPTLMQRVARFIACEMIPGDYAEFGVYRGESFVNAYHALLQGFGARIEQQSGNSPAEHRLRRQALEADIKFFAFDSFRGLPAIRGIDRESRDFSAGQYQASELEFRAQLEAAKLDMIRVQIIPGWFEETCTTAHFAEIGLRKIAVAWIDCDLYDSAVSVLEPITPLLQDGSVIIFDDWFSFRGHPRRGEQLAFGEWRQRHPELILTPFQQEGTWRMSFIVSLRE